MHTRDDLEKAIRKAIEEVTGITDLEDDDNLMSRKLRIQPSAFLYIFDILEKELELPVYEVFKHNTYENMTLCGLTDTLYARGEK